ncbi:MAG: hypothetical protein R2796_01180 [Chitinophagaceae bacterium]|nr:hypothetical protein [Chitinophagaceae bacterium]MCB0740417.1 hypothetical protein [Chitinophagaceae bacterium]HQV06088.1 hypothetical protein [Chitinophagaceae bacterium]
MKKILWLIPLSLILYACPFESNVALEENPVEPVDTSLLGYWYGIIKDGSDYFGIEALDFTKETDSTYHIIRYGKAIKGDIILPDTSYFTGFISYIDSQRYMNLVTTISISQYDQKKKREVPVKKTVYYIAALDKKNDTITVRTISENFSVRKIYNSPAELKSYVAELLSKNETIYDKMYSLQYRKYPRPHSAR